jgi:ABC-type transporter Mla MlaB component
MEDGRMFRITSQPNGACETRLVLEGRLVGETVEELRRIARETSAQGRRIALDLAALRYADAAGIALLRELIEDLAELQCASAFVSALLGEPTP